MNRREKQNQKPRTETCGTSEFGGQEEGRETFEGKTEDAREGEKQEIQRHGSQVKRKLFKKR